MSSLLINLLFCLLFINLVLNLDINQTKEKNNNTADQTSSNNKQENYINDEQDYDKNRPYNLTFDEMDSIMFCSIITRETVGKKRTEIENIGKKINLTSYDLVYEKVGTDIFEQCTKIVDIKIVNKYIKNLTYFHNFKWEKNFDNLYEINFTKYNNKSDLVLTQKQRVLIYIYKRIEELFNQKRADNQRDQINNVEKENQKIKIANYDMNSIPNSIKLGFFLLMFIILFGGVFYFLKAMEKKPKDKKRNKKKKIQ